jgi:hypothetical protein
MLAVAFGCTVKQAMKSYMTPYSGLRLLIESEAHTSKRLVKRVQLSCGSHFVDVTIIPGEMATLPIAACSTI